MTFRAQPDSDDAPKKIPARQTQGDTIAPARRLLFNLPE
jgi:hypothetical protein